MSRFKRLPTSKFVASNNLPIKDYYERRNKLLVIRETGGIGDVLMMRLLFEDFKKKMPESHLVVAVPPQYIDLLSDHPYIDEVVSSLNIDIKEYVISYNISAACGKYEKKVAPYADLHRSDIWANHCGIKLENHNMHLSVTSEVTERCRALLESHGPPPYFIFCPQSAIPSKNLDDIQSQGIIDGIKRLGGTVLCLHKKQLNKLNVPTIISETVIDFLGIIKATDYVVTVDTAAFHAAGGFNKPQVAIFSWADGKVYGKWYKNYILVQRHRDNGDWSCGPCYIHYKCGDCDWTGNSDWNREKEPQRKPCITSITSLEVIEAIQKMVKRWPIEGKDVRN